MTLRTLIVALVLLTATQAQALLREVLDAGRSVVEGAGEAVRDIGEGVGDAAREIGEGTHEVLETTGKVTIDRRAPVVHKQVIVRPAHENIEEEIEEDAKTQAGY